MIRVGLTGGIGSGKSLVAQVMGLLGAGVYDSDREARRLMEEEPGVVAAVVGLLGDEAYRDGRVNRKYVSGRVFRDRRLLEGLNAVVHPAVAADFERWAADQQGVPYVVLESAILFESGFDRMMDRVVVVTAPEAVRIERTCRRDGTTSEAVRARIANQMQEKERLARADFVIENEDRESTLEQILKLHRLLSKS
ncbi:MAG: dephospho-CoA kinase [Rikenellaceae bacterium]|nr:dephospho-CoA kinase [Rikenellaceae bacterium]